MNIYRIIVWAPSKQNFYEKKTFGNKKSEVAEFGINEKIRYLNKLEIPVFFEAKTNLT